MTKKSARSSDDDVFNHLKTQIDKARKPQRADFLMQTVWNNKRFLSGQQVKALEQMVAKKKANNEID